MDNQTTQPQTQQKDNHAQVANRNPITGYIPAKYASVRGSQPLLPGMEPVMQHNYINEYIRTVIDEYLDEHVRARVDDYLRSCIYDSSRDIVDHIGGFNHDVGGRYNYDEARRNHHNGSGGKHYHRRSDDNLNASNYYHKRRNDPALDFG